jgi:hypothetical protein
LHSRWSGYATSTLAANGFVRDLKTFSELRSGAKSDSVEGRNGSVKVDVLVHTGDKHLHRYEIKWSAGMLSEIWQMLDLNLA